MFLLTPVCIILKIYTVRKQSGDQLMDNKFFNFNPFILSSAEKALEKAKDDIVLLADTEGLTAHANAIKVRF